MEDLLSRLEPHLALFAEEPGLQAAATVVAAIVLAKLLDWILTSGLASWARRTKTQIDDQLIALLHTPIFVTVLVVGVWLAAQRLEPPPWLAAKLGAILQSLVILVWLGFLLRAVSLFLAALGRYEKQVGFLEPRTVTLFDNLSKLVLVSGAVYLLFVAWSIDVGGILVGAGVAGIALGLAAKDTLANIFSGIFIIADAPYQVGDYIRLDSGERGQVTQIGLRSTRLLTRDDIEVTVPNAVIANGKIVNESGGPWIKQRIRAAVGVAYGSDVDRVREILEGLAHEHPQVVDDPAPRARFRAFGESSLDFELMAWIATPEERGQVLDGLNTAIYKAFNREGIAIPFPQRDVHLYPTPSDPRSGSGSAEPTD
jgi:small-conductance mechanosensitive channel